MGTIEELNVIGSTVVRRLRRQKLDNGKPFLIWSNKLPKNQSYLEYPDHSIKIVTVAPNLKSFAVVEELTNSQAQIIRRELNLF
ncbi:hypothetical protein [Mucilaginibacter sp.]|jgi:hypothetical protein|uniref:hypothetical protein n=1 Tax=Mucilaginibacter sp. TaxID=1882438 RepID=UPI0025E50B31|nr:hypothetical protein [Mucilaginibacter sp.]